VSMDWFDVGLIDDIPQLGARVVATVVGDIAVFRTANDAVFALEDKCPHRGGPLSQGIVHDRSVACPLHNWVIRLDTGEARAPDVGCARTIPVRIDGRHISIDLASFIKGRRDERVVYLSECRPAQ
jgi:nitrite reductase (NADH) small subunit